jgi:hypothetical protein
MEDTCYPTTPHRLCRVCHSIVNRSSILQTFPEYEDSLPDRPLKAETFRYHASLQELESSSLAGCHLCAIVWYFLEPLKRSDYFQSLLANFTARDQRHLEIEVKDESKSSTRKIIVMPCVGIRSLQTLEAGFQRYYHFNIWWSGPRKVPLFGERDTSTSLHPAQHQISTSSSEHFVLAKAWMQRCLQEHSKCRERQNSKFWSPTRLVEVGEPSLGRCAKLCITAELPERPTYLTLSHCWGGENVTKLTCESFPALQVDLDEPHLPNTFKDALHITRTLGYHYLWIDSLCIFQDSKEDWAAESAVMGDISRNSVLTIAALWGHNSHSGCFTKRNPLSKLPCRLNNVTGRSFYVQADPTKQWASFGSNTRWHVLNTAPLHTRGWVMQEHILSPRTLYYGSSIGWDCVESSASESTYQISHPPSGRTSASLCFKWWFENLCNVGTHSQTTVENKLELSRFHSFWSDIMNSYSDCLLTRPTDRLAAISGIMNSIRAATGLTPVAGMWKECLLQDMLWRTLEKTPAARPTINLAPTWSWASVAGRVWYEYTPRLTGSHEMGLDWIAKVVDVKVTDVIVAPGPAGEFHRGYVSIKAPLLKMELDIPQHSEARQGSLMREPDIVETGVWYPDIVIPPDNGEQGNVGLHEKWLLLVATKYHPDISRTDYICLVLIPVDQSRTRWERVGRFSRFFFDPASKRYTHPRKPPAAGQTAGAFATRFSIPQTITIV